MEAGTYHKNGLLLPPASPPPGKHKVNEQGRERALASQGVANRGCWPCVLLPAGPASRSEFCMLQSRGKNLYILQFLTIWHLGLNKFPIVSPECHRNDCLAGGRGKNGNQKGERGPFYLIYTSTFI